MASSFFDPNTPDVVLKSLFSKYDQDNSDQLAITELKTLLQDDMGLSESEAQTYVLLLDKDGTGTISFTEFSKWLRSGERFNTVNDTARLGIIQKAVEMFMKYDTDGSHALNKTELTKVMIDCGGNPDAMDSAMTSLDVDGNGNVSFAEFLKWLNWVPMDSF